MNTNLRLQIVLEKPPVGVDFGLQKGSGAQYQTIQTQRSDGQDLRFDLSVQIKGDPQKDEQPVFIGPFAQGTSPGKFIYIDVGQYAGQAGGWSGRMKIPFTGITWDLATRVMTDSNAYLEARIPGSSKDGSPAFATVKNFKGWELRFSGS
jgi:hypothetical protein